eukprot:3480593-Prymnesium_polylepis.1
MSCAARAMRCASRVVRSPVALLPALSLRAPSPPVHRAQYVSSDQQHHRAWYIMMGKRRREELL